MKILKIAAKVIGILWIALFCLAAIFTFSQQSFDLSTTYGIGYFAGMLVFFLLMIAVGYFLFRWGNRKSRV